jgi:hypothetical protein
MHGMGSGVFEIAAVPGRCLPRGLCGAACR